jgi:hypothetical protein
MLLPPFSPNSASGLRRRGAAVAVILSSLIFLSSNAAAHGGVVFEEDVCVLNVGFLMAHFTVYQPEESGAEEFCEDIPEVGESVFVIDYLHEFMKEMAVDFRIINDIDDLGQYANWDDVVALDDIEADTLVYLPPEKQSDGTLTVNYRFAEAGAYIGIVTAQHPTEDKLYKAVFYFQVGGTDFGYLPLFLALIVMLQLAYLATTGSLQAFVRRHLPSTRT